jgi:hypothetical protein
MTHTLEEYGDICKMRLLEADTEHDIRVRENFAVLDAVGLLYPDMTPFELSLYGLAQSVWEDPTLLAAVQAQEGALTDYDDGSYEVYLAEAYAVAFAAMPPARQKEVRDKILSLPGWQQWAASKA